jgi:hypothetical protein
MRRAILVGLLYIGVVAGPSAANPHTSSVVNVQPSTLRGLCDVSACNLVTDMPGAGIGGKT